MQSTNGKNRGATCKTAADDKQAKKTNFRSGIDRRAETPRRKRHSENYNANTGLERRHQAERRQMVERRKDWMHLSEWCSVFIKSHA